MTAIASTTIKINGIDTVITVHDEAPPAGKATINFTNGQAIHITFVNSGDFADHQSMLWHISKALIGRDDHIEIWRDGDQFKARFINGEQA